MKEYYHRRYGPFLAVSNEGGGAPIVCDAAARTPKVVALGEDATFPEVGVALVASDATRP